MSSVASSARCIDGLGASASVRCGQAAIAYLFGIALLSGIIRTEEDKSDIIWLKELDSDAAVLSLANVGFPVKDRAETRTLDAAGAVAAPPETSLGVKQANVSHIEPPADVNDMTPDPVAYFRDKVSPKLLAVYRSVLKQISVMGQHCIEDIVALTRTTIVGTASTYNPFHGGKDGGGPQTASGETYDPDAWTAAIQIDLRHRFGGVRYGRLYQPAYALVESGDKRAIVRINDVGPLRPGRVIDLNERSMRYFDPPMERGLLGGTKVTLLPGMDWTPGPVGGLEPVTLASAQ